MTVSADTNITTLDIASVTSFLQNWSHTMAVNQGGGLHRVWFLVVGAEYAIDYSRDSFTIAFCLLLTGLYLAASLAIQLAEGGPGAGLPLCNLDQPLGGGRWGPSIVVPGLKCNNCCAEKLILISVFTVVHQKLKIICNWFFLLPGAEKRIVSQQHKVLGIVLWVSSRASCKLPTRSSKWTQMVSACRVGMP